MVGVVMSYRDYSTYRYYNHLYAILSPRRLAIVLIVIPCAQRHVALVMGKLANSATSVCTGLVTQC